MRVSNLYVTPAFLKKKKSVFSHIPNMKTQEQLASLQLHSSEGNVKENGQSKNVLYCYVLFFKGSCSIY